MNPFSSHHKSMMIQIYEVLISADVPRSKSALMQKANVSPQTMLFDWMMEKGLITKTTAPLYPYKGARRHPSKSIKAWYIIADRGTQVMGMYERLFDVLWLSDAAKDRKMGIHRG